MMVYKNAVEEVKSSKTMGINSCIIYATIVVYLRLYNYNTFGFIKGTRLCYIGGPCSQSLKGADVLSGLNLTLRITKRSFNV